MSDALSRAFFVTQHGKRPRFSRTRLHAVELNSRQLHTSQLVSVDSACINPDFVVQNQGLIKRGVTENHDLSKIKIRENEIVTYPEHVPFVLFGKGYFGLQACMDKDIRLDTARQAQ